MTDNRTTELLPCPFCGGKAHIAENVGYRGDMSYTVNCNAVYDCIASDSGFWYSSREAAVEAWNTRHVEMCENMRDKFGYKRLFVCSECGVTFDPDCEINYCPSCGRKVVTA